MPAWFLHWSITGLGAGWSAMVRCSTLYFNWGSSSVGVDWGVLDFKLADGSQANGTAVAS